MLSKRSTLVAAFSVLCLTVLLVPDARAAEPWQWSLTPYIWASDISEDLIVDGTVIGGNDLSFSDLVDITEASYQLNFQGMRGNWGFWLDLTSADLQDEDIQEFVRTEVRIKEKLYEGGMIWRPGGPDGTFDLLLGVRQLSVDERYTFFIGNLDPREVVSDEDYVDLMVGGRYVRPVGERWLLILNGDVSSGGSDLIWTAQALGGWRFGVRQQSSVLVGYRHRELDYDKADRIDVERTFTGPIIAIQIGF